MGLNSIKRISVLGAGWLGWPLAKHLQNLGYEVKTSTTTAEKMDLLRAEGLNPTLLQVDQGEVKLSDLAFFDTDLIILNIPPSRRRPDVEVWYPTQIRAIVDLAQQHEVAKILFIGSTSVYGDVNAEVTEDSELYPDTASAKALIQAEKIIKGGFPNEKSSILRMSGLVGGERKAGRFFAGKSNVTEGNAPVNLVYQEDCIGVIEALIQQAAWGKLYNVCADDHPRKADFYTARAILEGFEPPSFLPDDAPRYKVVSNEKVRRELGYVFKRKF
ncbi:MAG: SDR family oxidoreductase [Haliscomenobacter sp.]|uniref:SDR family oxidoreductase n=1 Tax=Haliscomenobacter sp. TaxID=2717303 RepID=UPI0029A4B4CE|nr:SDR family oxidoreductase [Haliscomenobacter sp.]MDX2071999.1 SDR family oxidoreductase [Haliscomenobacter sp.]